MKKEILKTDELRIFVKNYCLRKGLKEPKLKHWRKKSTYADFESIGVLKKKNQLQKVLKALDLYELILKKNQSHNLKPNNAALNGAA